MILHKLKHGSQWKLNSGFACYSFFPNVGHFLLKSLRANLVLAEKVRMIASCLLLTAFSVRFLVRLWRCVRHCSYKLCIHSFHVCHFPTLPMCVFVLLPAKSEVSMHGEVLSSPWLATPTWYTATFLSHFNTIDTPPLFYSAFSSSFRKVPLVNTLHWEACKLVMPLPVTWVHCSWNTYLFTRLTISVSSQKYCCVACAHNIFPSLWYAITVHLKIYTN